MGRRKGSSNVKAKIEYPRKCPYCEYTANNPSMYLYHVATHDPVPKGTLCHFGCGNLANFKNTNGKFTCQEKYQECPSYLTQLSERTKDSWNGDQLRKEKTRKKFFEHCCGVPSVLEKQRKSLKEKWGDFSPEEMKDFRHYARKVRSRAQRWAKSEGYEIGRDTFHVDHRLSVFDAWKLRLGEEIVNHPENLQILEAKKNCSKGATSELTLSELLDKIKNYGV